MPWSAALQVQVAYRLSEDGLTVVSVMAAIAIAAAVAVSDSAKRVGETENQLRVDRVPRQQLIRSLKSLAGLERITFLEFGFALAMAALTACIAVLGIVHRSNPLVIGTSALLCLFICIEAVRISTMRQEGIALASLVSGETLTVRLSELRKGKRTNHGTEPSWCYLLCVLAPVLLVATQCLVLCLDLVLRQIDTPPPLADSGSGIEVLLMMLVMAGLWLWVEITFARPSLYVPRRRRRMDNAWWVSFFALVSLALAAVALSSPDAFHSGWAMVGSLAVFVAFIAVFMLRYLGQTGVGYFRVLARVYLNEADAAGTQGRFGTGRGAPAAGNSRSSTPETLQRWAHRLLRSSAASLLVVFVVIIPLQIALSVNLVGLIWPLLVLGAVLDLILVRLWVSLLADRRRRSTRDGTTFALPVEGAGKWLALGHGLLVASLGVFLAILWISINPSNGWAFAVLLGSWVAGVIAAGVIPMLPTEALDGPAAWLGAARRTTIELAIERRGKWRAKAHALAMAPLVHPESRRLARRVIAQRRRAPRRGTHA